MGVVAQALRGVVATISRSAATTSDKFCRHYLYTVIIGRANCRTTATAEQRTRIGQCRRREDGNGLSRSRSLRLAESIVSIVLVGASSSFSSPCEFLFVV